MAKSILDMIALSRLAGDAELVDLVWREVAEQLAEQLDALAVRLADLPGLTEADHERVARAAVALRNYRAACTRHDDP